MQVLCTNTIFIKLIRSPTNQFLSKGPVFFTVESDNAEQIET